MILARNDLSVAYPIAIGLTLVFSTLAARIVIGEGVSPTRCLLFFRNLARDFEPDASLGSVLQNIPIGRIETHEAIGKLPSHDRHRAR